MATGADRPVYSIGAVARMLEVPASTLRAWEERYGLIVPTRSFGSQRLYSRSEVERLRYLKAQMDSGITAADAHRLLSDELNAGHLPYAPAEPDADSAPLILIAEKDPYAADLAEYFLRTEGWQVATALDGMQATLYFEERSPSVVILDLLISGGAGFRLLGAFAKDSTTQVVAVAAMDSADEAMRLGAAAFLLKPVEPLTLVSTVRDLVGKSAVVAKKRPSRR